jgi:hypothetical protein
MSEPPRVSSGSAASDDVDEVDDHYDEFLASVRARFESVSQAANNRPALFTTASGELFDVYRNALPSALQQRSRCATCRRFFERFGGLVTIDDAGHSSSALWSAKHTPAPYDKAVAALVDVIARAPITGIHLSSAPSWGTSPKGGWNHLAITPAAELLVPTDRILDAAQIAAEKREDVRTLTAALEEFPLALVKKAAALLSTGKLYRSEKCISVAQWLLGVHRRKKSAGSARARDNVIWRAVATAPPGHCHVRSSMIGTLLVDLSEGLPFDAIKARFDAKMHPLMYQRPTAAPSQGNIERAEKIIAQLRSAGALERRFAKLDDIDPLWLPAASPRKAGVFSHLKAKAKTSETKIDAPAVVMTWDKFAKRVLPSAAQIHYQVPSGNRAYLGLVTAKNPEAPPIIQWDSLDRRNSVTWYVYTNGSTPARWNLTANTDHPVTAITLSPAMWGGDGKHGHHGNMVIFVLEGAKDLEYQSGASFFPEFLKSEYREIRATLEAYAKAAVVEGKHEASACGLSLQAGGTWGHSFRVTDTDGVTLTYTLDRWD